MPCSSVDSLLVHPTFTLTVVIVRTTTHLLILFCLIVITFKTVRVLEIDKLLDLWLEACFFEILLEIL